MSIFEGCVYCGGSKEVVKYRMNGYFEGDYFIEEVICTDCERKWFSCIYCSSCGLPVDECTCEELAATDANG